MALPPHWIDEVFTSADVNAREIAHRLISDKRYVESMEATLVRAVEQAKQEYRESQAEYEKRPGLMGPSPAQSARLRFLQEMDFEIGLERIAQQYRDNGYVVITHPEVDQLPGFARDFGVDILATRGDERVLVQVKQDRSALEADPQVPIRAGITNSQPGWRYDLVLLNADNPDARTIRGAAEPTDEQMNLMLQRAEESRKIGVKEAALILLWGPLEAAMRRCTQQFGIAGRRVSAARAMLSQLYSSGMLSQEEFHRLEEAWKIRTELVHGFVVPSVDESVIQSMIDVTKRLMEESRTTQRSVS